MKKKVLSSERIKQMKSKTPTHSTISEIEIKPPMRREEVGKRKRLLLISE